MQSFSSNNYIVDCILRLYFTKTFRYLKWRNPHLCKLYVWLMQGKSHPQNSLIMYSTSILGIYLKWMAILKPSTQITLPSSIKPYPVTPPWATWWPWFAWTTTTPTTVPGARWGCLQNTGHLVLGWRDMFRLSLKQKSNNFPSKWKIGFICWERTKPSRHVWVDDFPFTKVEYVSFVEGTSKMMGFLYHRVI